MRIKSTTIIMNGIIVLVIVAAALSQLNLSRRFGEANAAVESRFFSILLVEELRRSSEELTRQVRNYAVTGDPAAESAYNMVLLVRGGLEPRPENALIAPGERRVLLDLLREHGVTDDEFLLVERANSLSDDLVALEVRAMNAVKGIFIDGAGQYTILGEPDMELARSLVFSAAYDNEVRAIMAPMNEFEERVNARTDRLVEEAMSGQLLAEVVSLIALALVFVFVVFNLLFSAAFVLKPLGILTQTLNDIANGDGDMTVRLSDAGRGEFADASRYFNQTIGKIRDMIVSIKGQSDALSTIGDDLAMNMTETASAMNEIAANIQSVKGRVLSQSASVNQTSATMEQVTANIGRLGGQVENQTGAVNQAASSIEEMIANIKSVTSTLAKNADNVRELQVSSEAGRSGLQEVAADIQEIERESEGLLEINSVMENIASQTNLLSMNAAIEAAHAGEAGKGFAVVADEIRKLAESSGEQSKTIGAVLKKIKDSVDKIMRSADSVLNKFEAIDLAVKTVAEQEEQIRAAMEEQGEGSRQVLRAAGSVGDITQQVRSGSQEMLKDSKEVIQESKNLERATQEITGGINEIAASADQVNRAVSAASDLGGKNRENIASLARAVSKFKV